MTVLEKKREKDQWATQNLIDLKINRSNHQEEEEDAWKYPLTKINENKW